MSKPLLTIGMAVYDDLDGVYFSVQAINSYHPELRDKIEIIVLDNNPGSKHGEAVKDFLQWVDNARYEPYTERQSTAVRDVLFRLATADYVISMDSHVLFMPGALHGLLNFYQQNAYCGDLIQGPMFYDSLETYSSHFDYTWQENMLGVWGCDERAALPQNPPFEIPMQGLGVFASRKDAWLGFSDLFRGFGGEEWYIHEKYRKAGKKAICLPSFRWTHRFRRPDGVNYRLVLEDRVYNYFVGFMEVGGNVDEIFEHFTMEGKLSRDRCEELYAEAKRDSMLLPMRLMNSAPEIPVVSCIMVVNKTSEMRLNESVEAFHRQYYPARELVIFNDGPNMIQYDHPIVKVINYPDGLPSVDDCIRMALKACNGDIICVCDPNSVDMPWRLSLGVEKLNQGTDFWQPSNAWHLGMPTIRPITSEKLSNWMFRRSYLDNNELENSVANETLECTYLSTISRSVAIDEHCEPIQIKPGWLTDYTILARDAAAAHIGRVEANKNIPTFVLVCDIVKWAEEAVTKLEEIGGLEIIIVDDCSSSSSMAQYLNSCPYEVIKLEKRFGPSAIWASDAHQTVSGRFLAVNSFYDISGLPSDVVQKLVDVADSEGIVRCGVGVRCDDLPSHNTRRKEIEEAEAKHWSDARGACFATDSGVAFIIGNTERMGERCPEINSLSGKCDTPHFRLGKPYVARYRPWYLDFGDLTTIDEEVMDYIRTVDSDLYCEYLKSAEGEQNVDA